MRLCSRSSNRPVCRLHRHRPRPQIGTATIGRQEVGILGILHSLITCEIFFSELGPVSVSREINFLTTDGVCRQNTHSHDTFVHVQLITARTALMFHSRTTQTRVAQGLRIVVSLKRFHHPSVMSHMLPHLPHDLSPVFRPFSVHGPVLLQPILHWIMKLCKIHGGVADTPNLHLPHLHFFNISHFSSRCCAHNFSLTSCTKNDGEEDARAKRRRQDCGKVEADGDEPDFHCLDKFLVRVFE